MKITIVGGGSTFTPGIIKSVLNRRADFPVNEICMYDNDEERVNKVAVIVRYFIEQDNLDVKLVVSTDPKEAFTDAEFIFAQMRVGKYAMRETDEKIPLAHGCVGQETCGAGGLAYGLRTIYPMMEVIDYAEKYSLPNHWILNYSNPAAIVSEACRVLRPNARIINICDMPISLLEQMAVIADAKPEEIESDYFGLNHFGWFTAIRKNGIDITKEICEHVNVHGLIPSNITELLKTNNEEAKQMRHLFGSWCVTMQNVSKLSKMFPGTIPNSYLQYYMLSKEVVDHSDPNYTRANEVMNGREKDLFQAIDTYQNDQKNFSSDSFKCGAHSKFIVDLATSLKYDLRKRFIVIVENKGAISNLPSDAMIEVPAYITARGPEVISIGEIPMEYKALMEQQLASEKLLVAGAVENSYQKVWQAFALNKAINDQSVAKEILDEMIIANKEYWPILK